MTEDQTPYGKRDLNGAREAGRTEATLAGLAHSMDILRSDVDGMRRAIAKCPIKVVSASVRRLWAMVYAGATAFILIVGWILYVAIEGPRPIRGERLYPYRRDSGPGKAVSAFDLPAGTNGRAGMYKASETP